MNQHHTIQKLKTMRLHAMAKLHYDHLKEKQYQDYTLDQYLSLLVDQEWEERQNKRIANLIKTARFRDLADVKNIDYSAKRGLDRNSFERLARLEFLDRKENILITGPTGTGKSYLAQAIGRQACLQLNKTLYFSYTQLMDQISLAKLQGTYHKTLAKIQKAKLLIIEDFGLNPIEPMARKALMEIVHYKYEQTSIIFTAQIPVANWHQIIGEDTLADAILDRLLNSSHRIKLSGESLRRKKAIKNS